MSVAVTSNPVVAVVQPMLAAISAMSGWMPNRLTTMSPTAAANNGVAPRGKRSAGG